MAGSLLFGRPLVPGQPGFQVREGRRQDAARVCALWQEMMQFHHERDPRFLFQPSAVREFEQHFFSTLRSRDAAIFVAELRGEIVGYVLGEMHTRKPLYPVGKYGFISDVVVETSLRRQGIGRALVDRLFEWFHRKNATAIELFVAEANPVSDAFWSAMGFRGFLKLVRKELE